MPSTLSKVVLAAVPLVAWYTLSLKSTNPEDLQSPSAIMTFSQPQNPKLGVYASPSEWRARLESLPDLQATGGKIPSFYCKQKRY